MLRNALISDITGNSEVWGKQGKRKEMLSSMLSSTMASSTMASSTMASSTMASSTGFIIGSSTFIGTLILIAFLLMYELMVSKEEGKRLFVPALFALSIIFFSVVALAVFNILK